MKIYFHAEETFFSSRRNRAAVLPFLKSEASLKAADTSTKILKDIFEQYFITNNRIMLSHYIKISFRELLKYRTQSIVSIIGLGVGFTAFILGGYWLRWETHFDNFHPEADRLYCLTTEGLVKRANGTQADLLTTGKNCSSCSPKSKSPVHSTPSALH